MRGDCGVNRVDGESNESVYERFGMSNRGEGNEFWIGESRHQHKLM